MTILAALLALSSSFAAEKTCNWCVFGQEPLRDKVLALASKKPRDMLKAVRKEGVCVKVMDSGRKVPKGTFAWSSVEKPTLKQRDISKIAGLMGKTVCKGEQPVAKGCPTILLASDAPRITLLHEYIHYLQTTRDPNWCPLSKMLWYRAADDRAWREIRDKEWDAHLMLWNVRDKLGLSLDDRIALGSEIIAEAEQRRVYDDDALLFLVREKPQKYLDDAVAEYKKKAGIKK